jgi:hypothetical protein
MYAIITKKDSTEIVLVWQSEKSQLTDGMLVCQGEAGIETFDDITSVEHTLYEFDGELPADFEPATYTFSNGEFVKK